MTKKQIELYNFIKDFALRNNYVPSYDEIIKQSGIYKSKDSISQAMHFLQDNGFVSLKTYKKRRLYTIKGIKYVEAG